MDQKYGEFVGVDKLHYAIVTSNTADEYIVDTPKPLAPVAEIAAQPEVNSVMTYYENKAANNYVTEGKTEIQVVVSNVDAKTLAELLGKTYDQASGKVYDSGEVNPPEVALGFRYNMGKNGYRYYWYLVGTFSPGAEEAASKSSDVDVRTYELTYTAYTTAKEFTVNGKKMSLKRIFADTSDTNFTGADTWFDAVPMPAGV